jgi:hypothetical protein
MKRTVILAAALAATGLLVSAGSAAAAAPPHLSDLCGAQSLTEADQLVARLSVGDIVGQLEPLLGLTMVGQDLSIRLATGTSLELLKQRLNCSGATTPAAPTTAPTTAPAAPTSVVPTSTMAPTTKPRPDSDSGGVIRVPIGGVQTGYGPGA